MRPDVPRSHWNLIPFRIAMNARTEERKNESLPVYVRESRFKPPVCKDRFISGRSVSDVSSRGIRVRNQMGAFISFY